MRNAKDVKGEDLKEEDVMECARFPEGEADYLHPFTSSRLHVLSSTSRCLRSRVLGGT